MDDIYINIEDYNPGKKHKLLIDFDDMIADMISNKKLNPVITELFNRSIKLNISMVFIMQAQFKVTEDVKLISTHYIIMKTPNEREFQQIKINNLSYINFK